MLFLRYQFSLACSSIAIFAISFAFTERLASAQDKRNSSPGERSSLYSRGDEQALKIQTNLISLTLTVEDSYGRAVSGLTKKAFSVVDDNQLQQIAFFSDADAPVSIGILFDVSGSMDGEKIVKSRVALERFITTSNPADEYFGIAFNDRSRLSLDHMQDAEEIFSKMTSLKTDGQTALYDAVYLGVEKITRGKYAKKAILVFSDGQDNDSRHSFRELCRLLKESDVLVYSVGIDDHNKGGRAGTLGEAHLEDLSRATGGRTFFPRNEIEMDEAFEQIALELRHQYSIGYTPSDFQVNGKWRKLKIEIGSDAERRRLRVRARQGYFATANDGHR